MPKAAEERCSEKVTIDLILTKVCRAYDASLLTVKDKRRDSAEARALAAWLVRETTILSLTDLGKAVNRDVSSLSLAASRLQTSSKDKTKIAELMEKLRSKLT